MRYTDTVIIGGGQAGLAMSRCLWERGVKHVVLERGKVGERWRSERWDSLRLLTPNWQSRLPHWHYEGDDPDGYMTTREFIEHLENYARSYDAPVHDGTTVLEVEALTRGSYRVTTDRGVWTTRNVVIATGHCGVPWVPSVATGLADDLYQIVPSKYRNPGQLPAGNVLVVGASATGAQLAEELAASGRKVTLAVGRHTRLPRTYRGRDILWWIDTMGGFMAPADPAEESASPAPQLVGAPDYRSIDVGLLQEQGVRLTGKLADATGHRVHFDDSLAETIRAADDQLAATLAKIDEFSTANGLDDKVGPRELVAPTRLQPAPTDLDLRAEGIDTIVWATGYRRSYPWLKIPVLDERGEIRHRGGVTEEPGLYVLGLRFQRRKGSNLIDGVGNDAAELTRHLIERRENRAA
jgi:putative flavoprotein involved in K+ transport